MAGRHAIPWDACFLGRSPMYAFLKPWAKKFSGFDQWPSLEDYQTVLASRSQPVLTASGKPLRIVPQGTRPVAFEEHYAPRIYFAGELQTRRHNWHDFFQFLTWCSFPNAKAVINARHIPAARQRMSDGLKSGVRSPLENTLSLFDEGGAVVYASDAALLQLIREFRWKELFWRRRGELIEKLKVMVFGHALYEKGLAPYVGMTANCVLLRVDEAFMCMSAQDQRAALDVRLAEIFSRGDTLLSTKDLSPFPILGMPGWDEHNEEESYYDDTSYFRPGRLGRHGAVARINAVGVSSRSERRHGE